MYDLSKDPTENERVFGDLYAGKQGFHPGRGQHGACPSYPLPKKKTKTPRIWPTFCSEACNFTFIFLAITLFYFSIPVRGGGDVPPPLTAFLLLGISVPGKFITEWWRQYGDKYAILTMDPKNAGLVSGPYIIWLLGALLKSQSSFSCPEPHKSLSALLVARHPPRYSTPFLIARCSPGCSMLPYHSALLDTLPVARIGTLLTNWCPTGYWLFIIFLCVDH